ncbi:retroviral-like aspartic protease family protein [Paraglaciecola aquimarina]|uniref:Retroviral-like aspartic protease family protein n=1 Tax=Paraglaciecola algarum TaxID=3050085 RepID=A0ABS9D9W5_9ALTE|nr:retroviral-like aspartic protease family protein [Paraglaciecola sp. G1-23]MCF2948579.1 retroviral-like aspartic protease family protein [Paraglaciecola sp. G1-23]
MNKWSLAFILVLLASLSLNLVLWLEIKSSEQNNKQVFDKQAFNNQAFDNQSSITRPILSWDTQKHEKTSKSLPHTGAETISSNQQGMGLKSQGFELSNLNREELLRQANLWLQEKNINALSSLLIRYLKKHPQDMDFLLIEAKLKVETGLLSDAIIHYYGLLRQSMTPTQQTEIEQQILKLASTTINQLKNTYSWDVLAEFVEPLVQIDPENRLYILSLARAYAEQFQALLMENILAALPFDDPAANAIRRIITIQQARLENPNTDSGPTDKQTAIAEFGRSVQLTQFGDQFVVKALLSNNQVDLLIDTGASITAVSKQFYDNLSNRYKRNFLGRFSVSTANGTVRAPIYQFRDLVINHVKVENISIVVLPMSSLQNANGLLGMNFLREFDFKIDQRQALMFIE